jgi:ABC-type uncharacterized transport system substrate-binding protein
MRRRDLLAIVAGAAVAWPLVARSQKKAVPLIGVLALGSPPKNPEDQIRGPIHQGLTDFGYVDGQNIAFEYRYAEGRSDRLAVLAAELVHLSPDIIVAFGPAAIQAAKQATPTIAIVMADGADPVGMGFVATLAHPGGNITGLSNLARETVGKRLELLKFVTPDAERIAVLFNPANLGNVLQLEAAQVAARSLGAKILPVEVRTTDEVDAGFEAITREHSDALFIPDDAVFGLARITIMEHALTRKLPVASQSRVYVAAGGLMSYGPDLNDMYRQCAGYIDKILKGAKPANLPVQQPTKFELVINLKTAKALGLTVPQSLLQRADEVIE